jgi:hypothetical protein
MGRWKYIRESMGEQLFDVSNDPGEKVNLRNDQREVFERIKNLYGEWNARMLPQP